MRKIYEEEGPHIGNLIKVRIEELNMTRAEFARRMDISYSMSTQLLNAPNCYTGVLRKACEVLEYDFFALLYVSPNRTNAPVTVIQMALNNVQASIIELSNLINSAK